MKNEKYISSSEIGDYVYCKRGWWLKFNGLLPTNNAMNRGIEGHEELSLRIRLYKKLRFIALCIIVFGLISLLLFVFYLFMKK